MTGPLHVTDPDALVESMERTWKVRASGAVEARPLMHVTAMVAEAMVTGVLRQVDGSVSDGFHTFDELYRHRTLLTAALLNEWAVVSGLDIHKSRLHSDGEAPFGGGWFIVTAQLPTGQISYHYPLEHWGLFRIPERERAAEFDGHTAADVADRLQRFLEGR